MKENGRTWHVSKAIRAENEEERDTVTVFLKTYANGSKVDMQYMEDGGVSASVLSGWRNLGLIRRTSKGNYSFTEKAREVVKRIAETEVAVNQIREFNENLDTWRG